MKSNTEQGPVVEVHDCIFEAHFSNDKLEPSCKVIEYIDGTNLIEEES